MELSISRSLNARKGQGSGEAHLAQLGMQGHNPGAIPMLLEQAAWDGTALITDLSLSGATGLFTAAPARLRRP